MIEAHCHDMKARDYAAEVKPRAGRARCIGGADLPVSHASAFALFVMFPTPKPDRNTGNI